MEQKDMSYLQRISYLWTFKDNKQKTMTKRILTCLCCCLAVLALSAQNRRKASPKAQPKPAAEADVAAGKAVVTGDVRLLFDSYRFEEAGEKLEEEMEKAGKKKQLTDSLEYYSEKAMMGENMLQATQKVVFVDSFVVDKATFLNAYRLNPSCGTLATYGQVFPNDAKASAALKSTTVYLNEFQDNVIYSYPDREGNDKLTVRNKIGEKWSTPVQLEELADSGDCQGYPYMLADGTTLYYASKGKSSLGGYDIYVTRYNTDTKKFLKPENIGMPFNSPANDYLYAIDEENRLGWFVSDRYQPEGKVCVYVFIPTESREVYTIDESNGEKVRSLARLASIKATQTNKAAVAEASKRLKESLLTAKGSEVKTAGFSFIVANGIVYRDLGGFKSAKARQMAGNLAKMVTQRGEMLAGLAGNRHKYAKGEKNLKATILKQEQSVEQMDVAIRALENDVRKEEQAAIGIK